MRNCKIRLESLLKNLKRNTQILVFLENDGSEIIRGKVKDIIKSEPVKNHRGDIVEKVNKNPFFIIIEISLDM